MASRVNPFKRFTIPGKIAYDFGKTATNRVGTLVAGTALGAAGASGYHALAKHEVEKIPYNTSGINYSIPLGRNRPRPGPNMMGGKRRTRRSHMKSRKHRTRSSRK